MLAKCLMLVLSEVALETCAAGPKRARKNRLSVLTGTGSFHSLEQLHSIVLFGAVQLILTQQA